jgi:hypothetical protein
MILRFGKFRGQDTRNVPDNYLIALANDFNRDWIRVMPDERFKFKVPIEVRMEAREELKRRGYKKQGSRWILNGCG